MNPSPLLITILSLCIWGLLPLYWAYLKEVNSFEILAHRVIWSLLFLVVILARRGMLRATREIFGDPRLRSLFAASSILIGGNWLLYIWSVNNGHVLDASLGYFINPIMNMGVGLLLFREQVTRLQQLALGIAAAAVLVSTFSHGGFPIISLTLSITFCMYSIIQRRTSRGVVQALTVETSLLFIPSVVFLAYLAFTATATAPDAGTRGLVLLLLAGAVTSIPLLCFNYGAQRLPFTTLGVLQYISPSIQFLLGVFRFHEQLPPARLAAFGMTWVALALYTIALIGKAREQTASVG